MSAKLEYWGITRNLLGWIKVEFPKRQGTNTNNKWQKSKEAAVKRVTCPSRQYSYVQATSVLYINDLSEKIANRNIWFIWRTFKFVIIVMYMYYQFLLSWKSRLGYFMESDKLPIWMRKINGPRVPLLGQAREDRGLRKTPCSMPESTFNIDWVYPFH